MRLLKRSMRLKDEKCNGGEIFHGTGQTGLMKAVRLGLETYQFPMMLLGVAHQIDTKTGFI